jgi:hypothetical protein
MRKQAKRERAAQWAYEAAQEKAMAERAQARLDAINSGKVPVKEIEGEEAVQFFMNHPAGYTREEAEQLVRSFEKNGNKLMVSGRHFGTRQ